MDNLPEDCRPVDQREAYAVQDRLFQLLGRQQAGWFLGGTSAESRRMLRMPEPYCARLIAATVHDSPARFEGDRFFTRGIDVEFAFRMNADLAPGARPFEVAAVAAAVASFIPAIDIVDSHYRDWSNLDWPSVVADNGTDGAAVLGVPATDWQRLDLRRMVTTLTVDGRQVATGSGAEVLDDPLRALTWLANHLPGRGELLRAGDLVVTGSSTTIYWVPPRSHVVATFAGAGDVVVDFD